MWLPNRDKAIIEERKLKDYLLSETHPVGKSKARFFRKHGFTDKNIELFKMQLMQIAQNEAVVVSMESEYGKRYVVDGFIEAIVDRKIKIRTCWMVGSGESIPRLITAYPL